MDETKVAVRLSLDSTAYERAAKRASKHADDIDSSLKRTESTAKASKAAWAVVESR